MNDNENYTKLALCKDVVKSVISVTQTNYLLLEKC